MPSPTSAPETFLSLNELARKANISYPTALKLVSEGKIVPDAHAGRTMLFKATRWEKLRITIRDNLYHYGGGAYVRVQFDQPGHPLNIATSFKA